MTPEDNDHDDSELDFSREDEEYLHGLPTTDSPSGIHPLNEYGEDLLRRLLPAPHEKTADWAARLPGVIPQVRFGAPLTPVLQAEIELRMGQWVPAPLMDIWLHAPGIFLRRDSFLWSPADFLRENQFYEDMLPQIFGSMIFFGGFDGFNGALSLDEEDRAAYYWTHEVGFTGESCPDIVTYVAEHLAWYATTFFPFCFQHGYVPRPPK